MRPNFQQLMLRQGIRLRERVIFASQSRFQEAACPWAAKVSFRIMIEDVACECAAASDVSCASRWTLALVPASFLHGCMEGAFSPCQQVFGFQLGITLAWRPL